MSDLTGIGTAVKAVNGLVDSAFGGLDDLFTSDEERGKLNLAIQKVKIGFKEKLVDLQRVIAEQVTARHLADMQSDSWLAKNVRPSTLVVLTLVTVVYLFVGLMLEFPETATNTHPKVMIYTAGLNALIGLDMVVYSFYFGVRGLEKIASKIGPMFAEAIARKKEPKKKSKTAEDLWDEEW